MTFRKAFHTTDEKECVCMHTHTCTHTHAHTYGTIPNNEPDIIIRDNEKGTCMLIDVAISGDRNVIKKEPRKSQGTTENSHIVHCTHTSESTNVKMQ